MRETLDIFVMIEMLLLFTVVGLPAPHLRHHGLNIETDEVMPRTETNLYEEQEYQVHGEKSQHCADPGYERSFVIEPDLRGDQLKQIFNPRSINKGVCIITIIAHIFNNNL